MKNKLERLFKSLYAFDPFAAYPKEADFAIPEIGKLAANGNLSATILQRLLSMYHETKGSKRFPYTRSACAEAIYEAACHSAPLGLIEGDIEAMLGEIGFDRFLVMALVRSELHGVLQGKIVRFLTHEDTKCRRAARDCIKTALMSGVEIVEHLELICDVLLGAEAEASLWAASALWKAVKMKQDIQRALPALEKAKEIKDRRIQKKVLEILALVSR